MYAGVPVVAVASGGPLETVQNDVTGKVSVLIVPKIEMSMPMDFRIFMSRYPFSLRRGVLQVGTSTIMHMFNSLNHCRTY